MAITKIILNGVEYPIGNQIVIDTPELYEGRELSEYTWDRLKQKAKDGDFTDLRVGDYKTFYLTNDVEIKAQIAGIDTYYGMGATLGKIGHHIDFISKDCPFQKEWGISTNNGDSTFRDPWRSNIKMRATCNEIIEFIPEELSGVITNKTLYIETRYSSAGSLDSSNGDENVNMGKIWLPTEYEVFGSTIWGTKGFSDGAAVQYPLFASNTKHKIKKDNNKETEWWLATTGAGGNKTICAVNSQGFPVQRTLNTTLGFPICFRIGS